MFKYLFVCLLVCLTWFFTSHQQSFSYVRTSLPGLNQCKARNNVPAQGHITVTPMRLEPAASWSEAKHSTTEPLRSLFKCLMGSDLECSFCGTYFCPQTSFARFVIYFWPVSVLPSMHAYAVWFEHSVLGLGLSIWCSRIFRNLNKIKKKSDLICVRNYYLSVSITFLWDCAQVLSRMSLVARNSVKQSPIFGRNPRMNIRCSE